MIPKLYVKENGYIPTFAPNILNGMAGMTSVGIPAGFIPGPVFVATTDGGGVSIANPTNSGDVDSLLQNHRRKMLRRAANRRSAQLSRARKKVRRKHSLLFYSIYIFISFHFILLCIII